MLDMAARQTGSNTLDQHAPKQRWEHTHVRTYRRCTFLGQSLLHQGDHRIQGSIKLGTCTEHEVPMFDHQYSMVWL